jgi:hypothetical protein
LVQVIELNEGRVVEQTRTRSVLLSRTVTGKGDDCVEVTELIRPIARGAGWRLHGQHAEFTTWRRPHSKTRRWS